MPCTHRPSRAQQFCPRYGEYVPELGVKISVHTMYDFRWQVTCSECVNFIAVETIKDDAVDAAYQHNKTDHPRDLVAYSINP